MLTDWEIAQMFNDMHLDSEKKRARFLQMSTPFTDTDIKSEHIFIRGSNSTSTEEESEDAELA